MSHVKGPVQTPQQVAQFLQVEVAAVLALLESGVLGGVTIGGEWRVPVRCLDDFLGRTTRRPYRLPAWAGVAAALLAITGTLGGLRAASTTGAGAQRIPYSGVLELNGGLVNGTRHMTFMLCPSADPVTTCPWSEAQDVVVSNGNFGVMLGASTALDPSFASGGPLYLGITVEDMGGGNAVTLQGRQALGAAPFAWRAPPGTDFTVDGNLVLGSDLDMAAGKTVASAGRLQASAVEGIYLYAKGGDTVVSNAQGGSGNLHVTGAATVDGAMNGTTGAFSSTVTAPNLFGQGQAWTTVTASRALATTYTNSTTRPIMVAATVRFASGPGGNGASLLVDGVAVASFEITAYILQNTLTAVVPPGSTYIVNDLRTNGGTSSIIAWREFR